MKKYLKQLPWLLLFYGIFIASDWIWQELWRYLIDNTESVESVLNWLSNFNILYYLLLLPLVGAGISYINTRKNGFVLPFLLLIPGVHYYYLFKNFFTAFFTQETRFIIQSLPRFIMLGIFMSCYSFLWEECCWQSNTVKNVKQLL